MADEIDQERYERYLSILREYLPNLKGVDEKAIMGGYNCSPNELLHEVENRTDVGLDFIKTLELTEKKFGDLKEFLLEDKIKGVALEKSKKSFLKGILSRIIKLE